ncbi:MAG TPA: hypothetical protein VHO48_15100, partial [Anaerolineaceae bacterium]|nr:hypothetical protein [Anaerolineaceae bacterium]
MNAVKPIAKSTWWGPYLQSAFIATISFFCFLLLLIQGAEWLEHSLIDRQKEQVHQDLPIYGVSLTHEYYQYLSILQEFDSWVSAHQPVLSDDAIAQELNAWVETYQPIQVIDPDPNDSDYRHVHGIPGIRSFFYADEGGLRWVHPSALGSHWVPEASLRFQPNSHSNNTV